MTRTLLLLLSALALASCARASDVQDALDAYHVVADVSGGGAAAASSRALAVSGGAGTSVRVTAALAEGGPRAVVLERRLDAAGVLAWSVELRPAPGPGRLLRLERIGCEAARAALPDLPPCSAAPKAAAPDDGPDVVEALVYPRP